MPSQQPNHYRVGVIGHTGRGNYGHGLDTVWLEMPSCQIVAVADADAEGLAEAVKRLRAPQGFSDYRKMLDQVRLDIVAIAPRWTDQHRDMVVAAAQRGLHVYMEKPMCRTPAEADEMIAACERNKAKLALAHQTRYSPKLPVVRDLIEDGKIGRVLELRGRGKEDARGGGEDLWVLGSHIMNLMHYFAGEPTSCFARVTADGRPITLQDVVDGNEGLGPLAGDAVATTYSFDQAYVGYFNSQRNASGGRFGLQIFGSDGVIEILTGYLPAVHYLPDPTWSPGRSGKTWLPISSAGVDQKEPLTDGGAHAGNLLACQDLIEAIEQDRLPECNMYEGRMTVEMICAVFASARANQPVPIPLPNRQHPLA